ncbi:MAG: hypothetical protein E6J13_17105, partial [Chloroflexi bacterium]
AAQAFVSRLGLRRLGARLRRGGRARIDARAERAFGDRRPARPRRRRRRADRRARRLPRQAGGRGCSRVRARLAAEPGVAAGGARARVEGGRARPGLVRGAGWKGDDAARRRHGGRAQRGSCAGARRECAATRRHERSRDFDRALVDAPCSGLGVLARRPDLRWRAQPLPDLQLALLRAAAERVRPGGTVVYAVCTLNADENEAVVDASGLEVDPTLGDDWPQFRHPRRPEFLLTLPHVHRTSGFFIARLRL